MIHRTQWLVASLATGVAAGAQADVVVNEVLGSTAGADAEYVELYNAGDAAADVGGWSVELWESDAGDRFGEADAASPYTVPAGTVIAAGAHFLFANDAAAAAFGLTPDAPLPADAIENGSYTLVLRDANGDVRQAFFVTDGDTDDAANVAGSLVTPDGSFGPDGTFLPPGFTRTSDGAADFALLGFTVGDPSQTPTTSGAGGGDGGDGGDGDGGTATPDDATIMTIQGAGHVSPLLGRSVETSGTVTAVDANAFYLQDPAGDGDVATSDAVLVFTRTAPAVSVGDAVTVTATVSEFFPGGEDTGNLSTTQLVDPTVSVTGTAPLPAPVTLGAAGRTPPTENIDDDAFASFDPLTDGIDFLESLEAMRVTVPEPLVVAPTNRFGEIFTVADGGATATGLSERRTLNISPDDFNPEKLQVDVDDGILPGFEPPAVDVGARLDDVTGVVGYGFGNFEIYPTAPFGFAPSDLLPETTTLDVGDDRPSIATYNVLNLDPNDDDGDADVADGRFAAVAEHVVESLGAPDVVALQEIQDGSGSADDGTVSAELTLAALVDAIVAAGGPRYESIDSEGLVDGSVGGQPGGNIRVAFLYDPARVELVGEPELLTDPVDQATNPLNPFFGSRIPLAADFSFDGEVVTVVNNHFSSKGGSAPILGTEQPFAERQEDPEVNGSVDERRLQAAAVNDYVAGRLAEDPAANVVALGDLNEFEFVSPVGEILSDNLSNTTLLLEPDERYSFVFQGNSQQLDHVLVSEALADGVEVDVVHVNVEFAEDPTRASDHDPVLVTLAPGDGEGNGGEGADPSADLTGDGAVDRRDYLAFARAYRGRAGDGRYDPAADYDSNGRVDRDDLRRFLALYRETLAGAVRGDVDRDGEVDVADLRVLARALRSRAGQLRYRPEADLNADDRVDRRDVRELVGILVRH